MRVGFDAYWWSGGPPSGKNTVRALVETWVEEFDDDVFIAVPYRDHAEIAFEVSERRLPLTVLRYPPWVGRQGFAAFAGTLRKQQLDAIVCQNFTVRAPESAVGTIVYDLIFVERPEWFTLKERVYLAGLRPTARRADRIFAISATEAVRISSRWPETTERLRISGLGVPRDVVAVRPVKPSIVRPGRRYILTVGRLNVRKNLSRLIQAFRQIAPTHRDLDLVIVGEASGATEPLLLPTGATEAQIRFAGRTPNEELSWLYRNAEIFVCPSLDEGLGLPLIEAAHFGAHILASDIPVFRETGLADAYFDPTSIQSIAEAMSAALCSKPSQNSRRELPTWEETVRVIRTELATLSVG